MSIRGIARKERQLLRRVQRDAMQERTRYVDRKITDTSHKMQEPDYKTPAYETIFDLAVGVDFVIPLTLRKQAKVREMPCAICREDTFMHLLTDIAGKLVCRDCDPRFVRLPRYWGA